MTDRTITTSTGTTVSLSNNGEDTVVLLDHPSAPADMRPTEAGRVIDCGFQFTDFADWSLSPEGLRAIADLIDGGTTAISESEPIGPDGDTGTRAITEPAPPALELTRGAWLRNHLGAEIFVVEPARTALAPDLWTVDTCGVGVELATAEGLAACGYTLVTEEPRPEYPTCGTCGRVQVHGTVYAECECP